MGKKLKIAKLSVNLDSDPRNANWLREVRKQREKELSDGKTQGGTQPPILA